MNAGRLVLLALALALPCVGLACDDGTSRPPPASDGTDLPPNAGGGSGSGTGDGGPRTTDGGDDASSACNALVATDGPAVDQLAAIGDPPIGTGGNVETGTYQLTDARLYGQGAAGATGFSNRGILELEVTAGTGTFGRVLTTTSQAGQIVSEVRERGNLVVSGSSIALSVSCPGSRQEQLSFTSTATTLVVTNTQTRESYTFTRR